MSPSAEPGDEALRILHATPYFVLGVHNTLPAALLRRTATPFPDLKAVAAESAAVVAMLPRCQVPGMVIDFRAAPSNNNKEFENAMADLRTATNRTFQRIALLVRTVAGVLQVNRLGAVDERGHVVVPTRDPEEAWRIAAGQAPR